MPALLVLVAALALPPAHADDDTPLWNGEAYPDPFHPGATIVKAELSMINDTNERLGALVRCWTATGALDTRFTVSGGRAGRFSGTVRWRFDDGAWREEHWDVNARGNQVIVPEAGAPAFLELMRARFSMELQLVANDDTKHGFIVPLDGSYYSIGPVLTACAAAR